MSITTESIDIRCNPEDVYVFVTSPQHQLEINDSAREIRGYDGESLQIGDQWIVILNFMGRDIESTYTLLEAQPSTKTGLRQTDQTQQRFRSQGILKKLTLVHG